MQLPRATDAGDDAPLLTLDTTAPPGGEVVEWLVDERRLTVRGAMLRQLHGEFSLVLRSTREPPHIGNPLWLATCRRLGLPEPPIDTSAPPMFSEWQTVMRWDGSMPRRLLGFSEDHAWLVDADGKVVALTAEGDKFSLPRQILAPPLPVSSPAFGGDAVLGASP